jgi:hypothetical protein
VYSQQWAEILQAHRNKGDVLADEVIQQIFQDGDISMINKIFLPLVRNEDIPVGELPPIIQTYLDQTDKMPTWLEPQKLQIGSDVFDAHGAVSIMMLFAASLPVLYAAQPGAEVLILTQRMTKHLARRIFETAQFVLDVTEPGGFQPQGRAIRTTQKVRLMHGAIRHIILNEPRWREKWNTEWGIPINQTDLAGTMMSFSTTIMEAMERSNIPLSDAEKEGYLHLWKVVGHILGVVPELMPTNYQDAVDLMDTWMQLYHKRSDAGLELAKVLIAFVQQHVYILPTLVTDSMRFWIGDRAADILNVPSYQWTTIILRFQRWIWGLETRWQHDIPVFGALSRYMSRMMMVGLLDIERGGTRPQFRIPSKLRQRLGMKQVANV